MLFIVRHILWFSFLSRYVYFCFFYSVDSRCVETLRTQVKISFSFQENKINSKKIRLKPLEFNNCWMAILWLYDIINVIKWNFIGQHYVVLAILREFFLLFRRNIQNFSFRPRKWDIFNTRRFHNFRNSRWTRCFPSWFLLWILSISTLENDRPNLNWIELFWHSHWNMVHQVFNYSDLVVQRHFFTFQAVLIMPLRTRPFVHFPFQFGSVWRNTKILRREKLHTHQSK